MKLDLRIFAAAILMVVIAQPAVADPAAALRQAQTYIDERKYEEAAALLEAVVPEAELLRDDRQRRNALFAIHFMAALAHSGRLDEKSAVGHLDAALDANPTARMTNPGRFPPRFVTLFNEAQARK